MMYKDADVVLSRHAYGIMVHKEPELLSILVSMIDDIRNDIYIHVDAKVSIEMFKGIKTRYSKIVFIKNRTKVYWGHESQIRAEFSLMKAILKESEKRKYTYFHLLSGADLPLQTQDYIHLFFRKNSGKEFISFSKGEANLKDVIRKTNKYYFFGKNIRGGGRCLVYNKICCKLFYLSMRIQNFLKIERKHAYPIYKGSQWVSVTIDMMKWLVSQEKKVKKLFYKTWCCDEFLFQTFVRISPYANNISEYGCQRFIDWDRGKPYTWRIEDEDALLTTDRIFARKFSIDIDREIIERIYSRIVNKTN